MHNCTELTPWMAQWYSETFIKQSSGGDQDVRHVKWMEAKGTGVDF